MLLFNFYYEVNMPSKVSRSNTVYGYPNPQLSAFPDPIVAQRAPTTADKALVGQIWVDQVGQLSYIFIKNSAGNSVWVVQSNNGGAAVFTSLTVNGTSILTGSLTQNNGATLINTDAVGQTINIGTGAAAKLVAIGSATAGSTLNLRAAAQVEVESNLLLGTAGTKIIMNGGLPTDFIGRDILVGGTVTVANTNIGANDKIFLSVELPGGTQGFLSYAINAGVDFTITSTNALDTSTVAYFIVRQI
jgi:hypothetical protein